MKAIIKATIEATYEVDLNTFDRAFKITAPMLQEALTNRVNQSIATLHSHITGYGVVEEQPKHIASLGVKLLQHEVTQTELQNKKQ